MFVMVLLLQMNEYQGDCTVISRIFPKELKGTNRLYEEGDGKRPKSGSFE
jgi:hypothetical protein